MADDLFSRFGDVGRDLGAVEWERTSLGPVEAWPNSLRNIIRLMLGSRFPMWMAWGPELAFLCNDAYRRDTLGAKYPEALGRPASEVWREIWPDIGPRIESVISTGNATWDEGLLLILERSGYPEETYHTFSYSPISDDDGVTAGMLCVVSEDTGRVIGQRRMGAVQELGTALAAASSVDAVAAATGRQLALDDRDLPFTIGYLFDEAGDVAQLAWSSGIAAGAALSPLRLAVHEVAPWPVADAIAGRAAVVSIDRDATSNGAPGQLSHSALVEPLLEPGRRTPLGFMVAGLSRHRALDEDYRGFVQLAASQVSAAVTRARAFDQERRRAEQLAALDAAKTTFFTNVSHELRTPLTLLLGPAEDALQDTVDPLPTSQRDRVELVQRNAERLLKLVNTLLDFSRLESDQAHGQFEPVDLARYTSELAAMFGSAMDRAGLAYTIDCPPLAAPVFVDREMWAKIVLNLVSNALKATFEGRITVRLRAMDDMVELSVIDTGIGIPETEQQRLFERFHRVHGAALRTHEGSGIGLALVAELAALHGGAASVTSEPGHGSTFAVRIAQGSAHLPADQIDGPGSAQAAPIAQYGAGYLAEARRWLADEASGQRSGADDSSGRPRVLVVDDNADMRDYIIGLLQADYQIVAAADGVQALELARAELPDLVLTDVMMPRLDGFGLLDALRSDPMTMHLPVVMLSARSGDEATVEGLDAGADDYLVKPFSARELLARVRSNLELDRVRRVAGQLERSQSLLDQAEQLAHVGSWEIDLSDDSVSASDEYFRILGVARQAIEQGGLAAALQSVEEEDRRRLEAALQIVREGGPALDLELRLRLPDGTLRLAHTHGILQAGPDGSSGFIRGSVQDITDQRAAEQAITASMASREAAAREHAIAEELQRSLLPRPNFRATGMRVAAYYRSGVQDTQAGGDWYDVISLPDDRTALVIGDVMGRGIRAAAVMGQLRATVLAYARLDLPPTDMLRLLDAAAQDLPEFTLVTCVYAVFDPRAGTLTYGNAGHMPPLLTAGDGTVRRLTVGDPPLGGGLYRGRSEVVDLPPGASITLYTDGLVEHRGSDIDAGINTLMRLLASDPVPAEARPTVIVEGLLPHEPDDDVAVLTATVLTPDQPPARIVPVNVAETGVSVARQHAKAALAEWGVGDDATFAAEVIISELTANAVRHGRGPIELRLHREGGLVVLEVSDAEPAVPAPRELNPLSEDGRGLHLVSALSERWGVGLVGAGKVVWSILRDD